MEVRDEIKKRMEESLKGCKIIDKQETPKKNDTSRSFRSC